MEKNIPRHVALIPDGNRRWAKKRGLAPWLGHKAGLSSFREVMEAVFDTGSAFATFWGASYDNLTKRTAIEVKFLLQYIRVELEKKSTLDYFLKEKVGIKIVGEWTSVVTDLKFKQAVENLEKKTRHFRDRFATILFGYDGKREMLSAVDKITSNPPERVTVELIHKNLLTPHLPPVDLVIRTGGEPHWSAGFMMWLTADSQFYFTDILWPDFRKKQLLAAYHDYSRRDRRFGK